MPGNNTACQQLRGSNTAVPSGEPVCLTNMDCPIASLVTASIVPKPPAILVLVPQVTPLTRADVLGDMPWHRWLFNQGVMVTAEGHGVPGWSPVRRFSARQDPDQPAVPFADEP
jgi:antitoxin (DNA-binding transcriptional repressor) of toxin-antitoxin stability system